MQNKLRTLIVEDEPLAAKVLMGYCRSELQLEVIGICTSCEEAEKSMIKHEIDLVFLDINLPGISGIDFVKRSNSIPKIIITTAYPQYAVEGFEINACDYLLKPFSLERFQKAVRKVINNKKSNEAINETPNMELQKVISVRADRINHSINTNQIRYVQSMEDYIKIYLSDKKIISKCTLKSFLEQLPQNFFIQVHRCFIISINEIESHNTKSIFLKNGIEIPVGISYKQQVFSKLQNMFTVLK